MLWTFNFLINDKYVDPACVSYVNLSQINDKNDNLCMWYVLKSSKNMWIILAYIFYLEVLN